jgi:NCS1 family nucleobase:cation symporter-1
MSRSVLVTNIVANIISPANDIANIWPARITFKAGLVFFQGKGRR